MEPSSSSPNCTSSVPYLVSDKDEKKTINPIFIEIPITQRSEKTFSAEPLTLIEKIESFGAIVLNEKEKLPKIKDESERFEKKQKEICVEQFDDSMKKYLNDVKAQWLNEFVSKLLLGESEEHKKCHSNRQEFLNLCFQFTQEYLPELSVQLETNVILKQCAKEDSAQFNFQSEDVYLNNVLDFVFSLNCLEERYFSFFEMQIAIFTLENKELSKPSEAEIVIIMECNESFNELVKSAAQNEITNNFDQFTRKVERFINAYLEVEKNIIPTLFVNQNHYTIEEPQNNSKAEQF